jgi:hypothetical protein
VRDAKAVDDGRREIGATWTGAGRYVRSQMRR